jgi:hypothetical protein
MDPVTGLVALAGISLASVIGLRLKKQREGFAPLPNEDIQYPQSVEQSQTRYNAFSALLNPSTNPLIPVGSSDAVVKAKRSEAANTVGGYDAVFSPTSKETVQLNASNPYPPRADGKSSLYAAIQFCREKGKLDMPFSILNPDGSVKTPGAVSEDGNLKFDEICGVCITNGYDEDKKQFTKPQGMVLDPTVREAAYAEKESKNLAYPNIAPSLGECSGAPEYPAFATNAEDLTKFIKRARCNHGKVIGTADECALCYDTDTYSSVSGNAQTNAISVVLRGTGSAVVRVKGVSVGTIQLGASDSEVELPGVKEGDSFGVDVTAPSGTAANLQVFGYLKSTTPKGGVFTMPLNLLLIVDDETGSTPRRTGTFETFASVGVEVDVMVLSAGRTRMRLRGTIPFTFVQASEFSALDCADGPFLTKTSSASAFATDQPCYAKGSRPGNYNDACLQNRILVSGCTNNGDLYKNPRLLNRIGNGTPNLSAIDAYLRGVYENDMVDVSDTKLCSGNTIQSPCDPFIKNVNLKFTTALNGSNAKLKTQAQQCLSDLYHNRGANEKAVPPRLGPTYSGLVTYKNNQKVVQNIYCLPSGALNPDTNATARADLARVGDNGYQNKLSVEAIRAFLNNQLEIAVDSTRNANTDSTRKTAIQNCFGTGLSELPVQAQGTPTVVQNPCGIQARFVRVLPATNRSDAWIEISQIVVLNKEGRNVALNKSTAGTTAPLSSPSFGSLDAGKAVDGNAYPKIRNFYHSGTAGAGAQFIVDLGRTEDITKILFYSRGDAGTTWARKNGMKLQLLNEARNVVDEKTLNSNVTEEITYLQQGADSSCVSTDVSITPITFPAGHQPGLYRTFYILTEVPPDVVPGNRGWSDRLGTPSALTSISFTESTLARRDMVGLVVKGFYTARKAETLYLYTGSDDGIYVEFDGRPVISNWTTHGATGDFSAPINITNPGTYPFELRYFQGGGGALCTFLWRVDDEADWKSTLTSRFSYSSAAVAEEETTYQNRIRARQEAELALQRSKTTTNISIRHPDGRPWRIRSDGKIVLNDNSAPVLMVDINGRSDVYRSSEGFYGLFRTGTSNAVRHSGFKYFVQSYTANNVDFSYRILPRNNGFILQNPLYIWNQGSWSRQPFTSLQYPQWGSYVGYNSSTDEVVLLSWNDRASAVAWTFSPLPVDSVTRALSTVVF